MIQISFLDLEYDTNMDLIMIAIDSFLVMFEECIQGSYQALNQPGTQDGKQGQMQQNYDSSGKKQKRLSMTMQVSQNLFMSDKDLSIMLTRCKL